MQLSDLQQRLLQRVGEFPNALPGNQFYQSSEATAALNAAQRLFVLLTLCLEANAQFNLSQGVAYYQMLQQFPDWLAPMRLRVNIAGKMKPSRLSDFAAADSSWSTTLGMPDRYALLGFGFLAVYKVPFETTAVNVTYARCPDAMALSTDVPEIPDEYHASLIDGAIPILRIKEGGGELEKVMPSWNRYLDSAQKLGEYVRGRNKEQGYDYYPFELAHFDRSKLLLQGAKK